MPHVLYENLPSDWYDILLAMDTGDLARKELYAQRAAITEQARRGEL